MVICEHCKKQLSIFERIRNIFRDLNENTFIGDGNKLCKECEKEINRELKNYFYGYVDEFKKLNEMPRYKA